MNLQIAQLINIVVNFNASRTTINNSLFDRYDYQFIPLSESVAINYSHNAISNPEKWLLWLKRNRCEKLYLKQNIFKGPTNDYQHSSFVNGGVMWLLIAQFEDHSEIWTSTLLPANKNDDKARRKTLFRQVQAFEGALENSPAVSTQIENLTNILNEILAFAKSQPYTKYFVDDFEKALDNLNLDSSNISDIIPRNSLNPNNEKLLNAAITAISVFGGMGSWNDMSFNDAATKNTYELLTGKLYDCINESIEVAVNQDKL